MTAQSAKTGMMRRVEQPVHRKPAVFIKRHTIAHKQITLGPPVLEVFGGLYSRIIFNTQLLSFKADGC